MTAEHDTPILVMILAFVAALGLVLLTASGCATLQQRGAIRAERALGAGFIAWDMIVDSAIAKCEVDPDPAECIEPIAVANDGVEVAVVAAVAALRAYWIGVAAGADPKDLQHHLTAFYEAVSTLPPEAFAGLLRGAR